jgi:tetratricopeptide (TPR) repeat protein
LRQETKDPLQIARSESDLAALYLAQRKFEKAKDAAERSLHEVINNGRADTLDRTYARYAYSLALCSTDNCPQAIPVLKDAIGDAKATMQPGDFPIGYGEFFLGFAYWRSGDAASAAQYMGQGTALMKEQLGWGHPTYLSALGRYAQFLRENQRGEAAKVVQREIRQAESVVDVRSLQASAFSFSGLR